MTRIPDVMNKGKSVRRFEKIERTVKEVAGARRLENASVGQGGIRLHSGGSVQVEDGGDVRINDGGSLRVNDGGNVVLDELGSFRVVYDEGRHLAVWVGGVIDITGRMTTGLINQHPNGTSYFQAYRWSDTGTAHFRAGPVDTMILRNNDEDAALWIEQMNDGGIMIRDSSSSPRVWVSHQEVGSGPQCVIQPSGLIQRVTSSAETKQDIEDAEVDPAEVLNLRGRVWRDRNAVEADPDCEEIHVGFIAEEVEAAGLDEFVIYDENKKPIGILYDRLSVALLAVVKNQESRLSAIEALLEVEQPQARTQQRTTARRRKPKRDRRRAPIPEPEMPTEPGDQT